MYSIKKEFRFEAAHRLMLHPGKCSNLHGHSYRVIVELEATEVAKDGMVLDFGELTYFKDYLEIYYDHCLILNVDDHKLLNLLTQNSIFASTIRVMNNEPTAENLAKEFYEWLSMRYKGVKSVTVWETEKCSATYEVEIEHKKEDI